MWDTREVARGLDALRAALARALDPTSSVLAPTGVGLSGVGSAPGAPGGVERLLAVAEAPGSTAPPTTGGSTTGPANASASAAYDDVDLATSSEECEAERTRLIALVELARGGDAEAFGALYDHYHLSVYRFLFYKTRSVPLAEDLTSETFFRALRNMTGFRWQGKDFGAWLMTIARNLATDHFKAGRTRLELTTDEMGEHDSATDGPEALVLAGVTNQLLLEALDQLPEEQRDCLSMRFLQSMSIAATAAVLGRSEGAVKQLQLRGVRNLAKLLPEGMRER